MVARWDKMPAHLLDRRSEVVLPKRSKMGNKKTEMNGRVFDSEAEAWRSLELEASLADGQITELEYQPEFSLQPKFTDKFAVKHRAIAYRADFAYVVVSSGRRVVEDVKGHETSDFKLKRKLFCWRYPDLHLVLVSAAEVRKRWKGAGRRRSK